MSSFWSGYSGNGLLLSRSELESMMTEYKKKNPAQAAALDEALEDMPFDEISFIYGIHAGTISENVQETKDESVIDKTFEMAEISDDHCQGPMFWPFYRADGRMNVRVWHTDGRREDMETYLYDLCEGPVYMLFAKKDMDGVQAFVKKPYASYNEFVKEFVDQLGAYLPEDFDWNAHLGHLSYACFA